MPRDITTTVYTFSELSPKAQEVARQWWREATAGDNHFAGPVYDEAQEVSAMLGITVARTRDGKAPAIYWSGFASQGDGASFEGSYSYKAGAVEAVKEFAPEDTRLHRVAQSLQEAAENYPRLRKGSLSVSIARSGRYCHSHSMGFEFSEYGYDVSGELADALRSFADWIYRELEAAHESETSDEAIGETLEANDYTFTADGKRYG